MFAHPIRQRSRQLDGEHHVGLGNFNPSSSHGLLHIPACLPHRHAVPTGHRASDGDGGHARPDQIGGGIDPPGVFDAIDTATTNHATNLLPIMTLLTLSARKKFQPPVAQRHLETEVAHCVGGVLSPLLSNVALSVLDEHFVKAWAAMGPSHARERRRRKGLANYRLIRYADDFVVMVAGTRAHAASLREEVAVGLAAMGLRLSEAKTRIVHLDEGFDFLGFRIQRHRKRGSTRRHLYTYPSKAALAAIKTKVRTATREGKNEPLAILLGRLNPALRGWTNYF